MAGLDSTRPPVGIWRIAARSLPVAAPVILGNAAGQALLILGSPPTLPEPTFVLRVIGSILLLTVTAWLLVLAVHASSEGKPFRVERPRYLLWTGAFVVAASAAWVVSPYLVPPVLLLALTQVPAVVSADPTPVRTTWAALRAHPVRAAGAIVFSILLAPVSWVVSLLCGFFVTGPLGSILAWLWLGVVALLLLCVWTSLVQRSASGRVASATVTGATTAPSST